MHDFKWPIISTRTRSRRRILLVVHYRNRASNLDRFRFNRCVCTLHLFSHASLGSGCFALFFAATHGKEPPELVALTQPFDCHRGAMLDISSIPYDRQVKEKVDANTRRVSDWGTQKPTVLWCRALCAAGRFVALTGASVESVQR